MKPILFNTEMVKAILDDRKTVTRRKIDVDITNNCDVDSDGTLLDYQNIAGDFINPIKLCRYKVGDILYVRETWSHYNPNGCNCDDCRGQCGYPEYLYRADGIGVDIKWRPSIHMPKEAARIFLKVTDVRVERLQDITEEQATAEGAETEEYWDYMSFLDGVAYPEGISTTADTVIDFFADIWNGTLKKKDLNHYGWEANPWVFVIKFKRLEDK